jgi:hypothetical protein
MGTNYAVQNVVNESVDFRACQARQNHVGENWLEFGFQSFLVPFCAYTPYHHGT